MNAAVASIRSDQVRDGTVPAEGAVEKPDAAPNTANPRNIDPLTVELTRKAGSGR